MSIKASCGHKLEEDEGLGFNVSVKDNCKDGTRCVSYMTLCLNCLVEYRTNFRLLENREDEINWINNKMP